MIKETTKRRLGTTQLKRRLATQLRVEANRLITLSERCQDFALHMQARTLHSMATRCAAISLAINAVADEERDPRGDGVEGE